MQEYVQELVIEVTDKEQFDKIAKTAKKDLRAAIKTVINFLQNRKLTPDEARINKMYNEMCVRNSLPISESTEKAGFGKFPIGFGAIPTRNIKVNNFSVDNMTGTQRAGVIELGYIEEDGKKFKISVKYVDKVIDLGKEFDISYLEPIKVNYDPETCEFECWDGQHRLILMLLFGIEMTMALVFQGLEGKEIGYRFMNQNKNRDPVGAMEKMAAGIVANPEGNEAKLHKVCEDNEVTISNTRGVNKNVLSSFKTSTKVIGNYDEKGMNWIINFIKECFPNYDKRFQARFIEMAADAYAYNYDEVGVQNLKLLIKKYKNPDDFIAFCAENTGFNGKDAINNARIAGRAMHRFVLDFFKNR